MSQPKSDNGANLIIDALLTRMSELDRYSDDECVIANKELLPLDVVVDECGDFGFVADGLYDDHGRWLIDFVGRVFRLTHQSISGVRTIYQTEAVKARRALVKYLGGE